MKSLLPLLLLLAALPVKAEEFTCKVLLEKDGLSHNEVHCLLQDREGQLWFGTHDGVDLYDGYRIRSWRLDRTASLQVGVNPVLCLMDLGGRIAAGTEHGIFILQDGEASFFPVRTRYGVQITSEVSCIRQMEDGTLWIGTQGQGLFIYHPEREEMEQHSIRTPYVDDIVQGPDGRVYLAAGTAGLVCCSSGGEFMSTCIPEAGSCLLVQGSDILLGRKDGITCYDTATRSVTARKSLPAPVRTLVPYGKDGILAGTDNGCFLYSPRSGRITPCPVTTLSPRTGGQEVRDILTDIEGTLWLATSSGVLGMPERLHAVSFYALPQEGGITCISETRDGTLWVGSHDGLFRLSDGRLVPVCGQLDVACLLPEGDRLWVGTDGEGLFAYGWRSGTLQSYRGPGRISSGRILCLSRNPDGGIYVGTDTDAFWYDPVQDRFLTVSASSRVYRASEEPEVNRLEFNIGPIHPAVGILQDGNDIWIATGDKGVFRNGLTDNRWTHYTDAGSGLGSNFTNALFRDSRGQVWVGTAMGLFRFRPGAGRFEAEPVPGSGQVVNAIEEDAGGHLWICGNYGITRIDPSGEGPTLRLTTEDGLHSNQFLPRASFFSSDGTLWFGGIAGLSAISTAQVTVNKYAPPVHISGLQVTGEEHAGTVVDGQVVLPYRHNSFTVTFAALSYVNPGRNRFRTFLKGFDDEWSRESTTASVSYTNVSPGRYEFFVEGSNNDGIWSEKPARLVVIVTPPWWMTRTATVLYLLTSLGLVALGIFLWDRRLRQTYHRRLSDQKLRFFVNMIHEIRTPLTMISLPLEKLRESARSEEEQEQLNTIQTNLDYILGSVNQMLDLQKNEAGMLGLQLQRTDLAELVRTACGRFRDGAALSRLDLRVTGPESGLYADLDEDKVRRILDNLLGNAMKYARSRIEVSLEGRGTRASISVADDGPGVQEAHKERIFETFYQVPGDTVAASSGTGLGLAYARALAEAHKGSLTVGSTPLGGACFVLELPLAEALPEPKPTEPDGCTVLVVEDNPSLRGMIAASLGGWYQVRQAADGEEALACLAAEGVDVIVSDVMMPRMDGIQLCRRVKEDFALCHVPLILLTAKTTLEAKAEGLESGADAYVEKPFTIKQLHAQIENLLRLKRSFRDYVSRESGRSGPGTVPPDIETKDAEFLNRIDSAIEQQISEEDFSIESLAGKVYMSPSTFYRKFKALTGLTPNDYLKNYRLNRAAEMIRSGARINEAALEVGFTSPSYFAKCFKAKFGCLPKDYVK